MRLFRCFEFDTETEWFSMGKRTKRTVGYFYPSLPPPLFFYLIICFFFSFIGPFNSLYWCGRSAFFRSNYLEQQSQKVINIPIGFDCDGASVRQIVWTIVPRMLSPLCNRWRIRKRRRTKLNTHPIPGVLYLSTFWPPQFSLCRHDCWPSDFFFFFNRKYLSSLAIKSPPPPNSDFLPVAL